MGQKIELDDQGYKSDLSENNGCIIPSFDVYEIIERSWSGDAFMRMETLGPGTFVTLNKSHKFYEEVYLRLKEDCNEKELNVFELLLLSFVRAQVEFEDKVVGAADKFNLFHKMWGNSMKHFLNREKF